VDRSRFARVVLSYLLVGILGAALVGTAGAHVNSKFGHLWKEHIKPKLSKEGTVNTATNPIDWTQLKNVPSEIADGQDAVGEGGGGGDITSVAAGAGLSGGAESGDATLSVDTSTIQSRVSGACGSSTAVAGVNANGTVTCTEFPAPSLAVISSTSAETATGVNLFTTLPGSELGLVLNRPSTVLATFGGESQCTGASGFCMVQILLDGTPMVPNVGSDFSYDSTGNGTEPDGTWEAHSFQRYALDVPAGEHIVSVQYRMSATAEFRIDDWTLSALSL
jgi:hypothetical protein